MNGLLRTLIRPKAGRLANSSAGQALKASCFYQPPPSNVGYDKIQPFESCSRFVCSSSTSSQPFCSSDEQDMIRKWWRENGGVVMHAIRGGSFLVEGKPSLSSFERVYAPHAEYHDLFIITKGQPAVRYSFAVIGYFWLLEFISVGDIALNPSLLASDGDANADQLVHVLRVPYTMSQRLKLFPLIKWQYSGWVDLHFCRVDKTLGNGKIGGEGALMVSTHDDRMRLGGSHIDVLTWVLGIPLIGSVLQLFRRTHGSFIRFLADRRIS